MIQLGVATIHFTYPKCDDAELQRLGLSFFEIAENAVHKLVPFKADVIVEIEQASLKVRSKIVAAAVTVGAFLSQYGSIREGASYLSRDIRSAADFAIEKIEHSVGVRSSDVIAKRRNPTLARRIKRVFEEVERGRIDSEEAMQQLVTILDPDAEGAVTPKLIEDLKGEVASTHRNRKTRTSTFPEQQPIPYVRWREPTSEIPRKKLPPSPREKPLRPRRLRITREDGQIKIDEVV
jgi:hypothetical protein